MQCGFFLDIRQQMHHSNSFYVTRRTLWQPFLLPCYYAIKNVDCWGIVSTLFGEKFMFTNDNLLKKKFKEQHWLHFECVYVFLAEWRKSVGSFA